MATTDTDALEERIARELFYTESPEERHRDGWLSAYSEDRYLYRDLAAAVLPIVDAAVKRGQAEAWERGHVCGFSDAQDSARHIIHEPHNPYRGEQTNG